MIYRNILGIIGNISLLERVVLQDFNK